MKPLGVVSRAVWTAGIFAVTLILCGCPAQEKKPVKRESPAKKAAVETPPAPVKDEQPAAPAPKLVTEPPTPAKTEPMAPAKTEPSVKADVGPALIKPAESKAPVKEEPVAPPPAPKEKTTKRTPAPGIDPDKPMVIEKPVLSDKPIPPEAPKIRDLGQPLVDNVKSLTKLDPQQPVWIDVEHKQVIFLAETCQAEYPLEFFVTLRDRGYEACVVMDVRPSLVHAGLLAVGAKPGTPVKFEPKYAPPTGTEVQIEVRWKDKAGKVQTAPAQQWIRDIKTKKAMAVDWVFAGSGFRKDPETGRDHYLADSGDFISVLNLPTATLDIPIASTSALESRTYEGFVANMPPQGTPVTIVLKPKLK